MVKKKKEVFYEDFSSYNYRGQVKLICDITFINAINFF